MCRINCLEDARLYARGKIIWNTDFIHSCSWSQWRISSEKMDNIQLPLLKDMSTLTIWCVYIFSHNVKHYLSKKAQALSGMAGMQQLLKEMSMMIIFDMFMLNYREMCLKNAQYSGEYFHLISWCSHKSVDKQGLKASRYCQCFYPQGPNVPFDIQSGFPHRRQPSTHSVYFHPSTLVNTNQ